MKHDNEFDKRMKQYEKPLDIRIVPHIPTILRVDGKAFHTYTKKCMKPYDTCLMCCFWETAINVYKELHYDVVYGQSDELSFLFYRPNTRTQEDFDGRLFKLASIGASVVTANFNRVVQETMYSVCGQKPAYFDCRVFQLPRQEVVNYFIWRQQDAVRNSLQMLGQAYYSHKQLNKKSTNEIQEMLFKDFDINWNDIATNWKRGWCVDKEGKVDYDIPIFTKDRNYIEKYLINKETEEESNV